MCQSTTSCFSVLLCAVTEHGCQSTTLCFLISTRRTQRIRSARFGVSLLLSVFLLLRKPGLRELRSVARGANLPLSVFLLLPTRRPKNKTRPVIRVSIYQFLFFYFYQFLSSYVISAGYRVLCERSHFLAVSVYLVVLFDCMVLAGFVLDRAPPMVFLLQTRSHFFGGKKETGPF